MTTTPPTPLTPPRRESSFPVSFFFGSETVDIKKYFTHVHYVCIHWTAGCHVRILLLLVTIIKSVDYATYVNYTEDIHCKLKTEIPVLERFATLIQGVSYAPIVTIISVINGKILTLKFYGPISGIST